MDLFIVENHLPHSTCAGGKTYAEIPLKIVYKSFE